jgi:hypothetical protein
LIRDVGFEPLDGGPLRMARYTEPFTLLVAQLAYEGDRGPELAYRFEWLGKQRASSSSNRSRANTRPPHPERDALASTAQ